MNRRQACAVVAGLLLERVHAAPPPAPGGMGADPAATLAQHLRGLLLSNLPDPLFEDQSHWGKRKKGPLGKMKNDGRWWKIRINARDPHKTLFVDVRDVQQPGGGRTTFRIVGVMDANLLLERQTWALGARLYSGSTRARARLKMALDCEVQTRFEKSTTWIPDTVFRLRVLRSDFAYDNLVVEHTAGVGGEAARMLGDLMVSIVRQVRPSLERNLTTRANAAIVKAADTKEVRISLSGIIGGKKTEPKK